jgi:hypothetical protein
MAEIDMSWTTEHKRVEAQKEQERDFEGFDVQE